MVGRDSLISMLPPLAVLCFGPAVVFGNAANKKADGVEHPGVLDHVGLLVNGPPGAPGLPFI